MFQVLYFRFQAQFFKLVEALILRSMLWTPAKDRMTSLAKGSLAVCSRHAS